MKTHNLDDVKALARWLDSSIPLPLGMRIGWDGIIGLIPGVGNVATTGLSLYILARAAHVGAPGSVIARMGLNLVIDNALDAVPILGNLFDFVWKANEMNLRLLQRYNENPLPVTRQSKWAVALILGSTIAVLVLLMAGTVWLSIALLHWIFSK